LFWQAESLVRRQSRLAGGERVFVERDVDEIDRKRNRIVIRRAEGACPEKRDGYQNGNSTLVTSGLE
jgi:hypothetical protein